MSDELAQIPMQTEYELQKLKSDLSIVGANDTLWDLIVETNQSLYVHILKNQPAEVDLQIKALSAIMLLCKSIQKVADEKSLPGD